MWFALWTEECCETYFDAVFRMRNFKEGGDSQECIVYFMFVDNASQVC